MRERLDTLLVARGLFATRAQARAAVLAGEVRVDGAVVDKPGTPVAADAALAVAARPASSRAAATSSTTPWPRSASTSTGRTRSTWAAPPAGFVDRLLQGGAARVVAVDVGYGQLDWRLREDAACHGAGTHQRP